MIRIAEKEISVNIQIKMQREDGSFQSELYIFDPGWGDMHIDPVTGQMAKLYDHVLRNIKLSGGIQIWFLVPRYRLLDGSCMFRVLPRNLCEYKHYATEVIQDEIDRELEAMLSEEPTTEEKIQGLLNGDQDAEERPCERTKWLWRLWYYRNLLLIESVLRMIYMIQAEVTYAKADTLEAILIHSDYMLELRTGQPDDWLNVIIQAAWNCGRPLIPLRAVQSIRDVWECITVYPISE